MTHAPRPRADLQDLTRTHKTLAAVMNGFDPGAENLAALAGSAVDVATLHLSAAAALRRQLLESSTGDVVRSRRPHTPRRLEVQRRAYELALALAGRYSGDIVPDGPVVNLSNSLDVEAAVLLGSLQVRLLESICSQISTAAEYLDPCVAAGESAMVALNRGEEIAPGIMLIADHSAVDRTLGLGPWLHATSVVTVAGQRYPVVVDAGPDRLLAVNSARMASPVTVAPTEGRWPVSVVEDCLKICATSVSDWVAAAPRRLSEDGRNDLVIHQVAPLRNFLVSPATAELTGTRGVSAMPIPLRAGPQVDPKAKKSYADDLERMRCGGLIGRELPSDTRLRPSIGVRSMTPDAAALLAGLPSADMGGEAVVTVNLDVPEWFDIAPVVRQIRTAGTWVLTEATPGWIDRDAVVGRRNRLSLRILISDGLVCATPRGQAVVLPAGTRVTFVGADTTREHTTLYGVQSRFGH